MYNDNNNPWGDMYRNSRQYMQSELEGGPESIGRDPNLVSNSILQQEYPNTVVIRGSLDSNKIALTFDDGPDPRFTPQILDILNAYGAKATFFLLGARAAAYPDIVRRIQTEGHAIGNHTYWHPNLSEESLERADWEISTAEETIEQIVGFRTRLFRPPYGAANRELIEFLAERNYSVILWNVDSLDWMAQGTDVIANIVLANTEPGSIILMHDGGDWTLDLTGTVNSLHQIIPRLQQEGMEFVTVPELIGIGEAQ